MTKTTPLANRAARLEAQLAAIKLVQSTIESLRGTLTEFPELREDFADEIRELAVEPKPTAGVVNHEQPQLQVKQWTNRDRLGEYFKSRGNRPSLVSDISEATGIPAASVRHAFSTGHREDFGWVIQGDKPLKQWRLVTDDDVLDLKTLEITTGKKSGRLFDGNEAESNEAATE